MKDSPQGSSMVQNKAGSEQANLLNEPGMSGVLFETQGIFTDHYLKQQRRGKLAKSLPQEPLQQAYEGCRELYSKIELIQQQKRKNDKGKGLSERDIRDLLLDKVLPLLGFTYIPESSQMSGQTPDYVLFSDEAAKSQALILPECERYQYALAILEAKFFELPLSNSSKRDSQSRPFSRQVHGYLHDAQDANDRPYFRWAILTNGEKWRLYCRDAYMHFYFELNLAVAIQDFESFKLFYALFRREAFIPSVDGRCLLDRLRTESFEGQQELEKKLRRRIFALVYQLADGFYSYKKNGITQSDFPALYEGCLIVLYRLLFILYAEGKGLLPVKDTSPKSRNDYRALYSLRRFQTELIDRPFIPADDVHTTLWSKLTELFDLIDGTDAERCERLKIPQYNGGLFNPRHHQKLTKWKLGDYTIQQVLRGLIFVELPEEAGKTKPIPTTDTIDYATLSVQQLGSIYEGLLDYVLELNDGKLTLVRSSKERKESGSYYTPDWVVDYIVKETLVPLIERIEQSKEVKNGMENCFADAVLKLHVLDPAMGSGHFLVRVTEYLADVIADHKTTTPVVVPLPDQSPEDAARAYWRRRVVESCIYGVDLNPLAVELAKLSLWLTCISQTDPLNFLDHHLRHGNALAGAECNSLTSIPDKKNVLQITLFQAKGLAEARRKASEALNLIRAGESRKLEEVKAKESRWQVEVEARMSVFRLIADLRTAIDFGYEVAPHLYKELSEGLLNGNTSLPQEALEISNRSSFHHWELAFPEVFDSTMGVTGFDAIVGNPPYVRQETLGEFKHYLQRRYDTYRGMADLYVYFIEKGMYLLCDGGRLGMIISNMWMHASYGEGLRKFLVTHQIEKLINFGELKVFESSSTFPLIMTVEKKIPDTPPLYASIKSLPTSAEPLALDVKKNGLELAPSALAQAGFTLVHKDTTAIFEKMKASGILLGTYLEGKIFYGIKTGFNKAFVINEREREELIRKDPKSAEIIVPFVVGDDVRKYQVNWRSKYLILTQIGVEIEEYPAIFEHLQAHQEALEKRCDQGNHWWELRSCDYYDAFLKPKIVWPVIAKESRFGFTREYIYLNDKCFFTPVEDFFLLGVLNSPIAWQYFLRNCSVLGDPDQGGRIELRLIHTEKFPVAPTKTESDQACASQIRELVNTTLKLHSMLSTSAGLAETRRLQAQIAEAEAEINRLVYKLYDLTLAEIALIEGKSRR